MKAFKVHNAETVKQEVNLPAGTYTYSCRVIPVGTSYTFRLDNQSFTFEGLTAGVLNKRMKHTFELTEAVSFFYLSNTIGDCVYEPQIEEGVFATTPGAHPLDFERLISEAGMEIDHEALTMYAKKADVSAEIKIQADEIKSTVGNISNDVDGLKGDMTTISQTVNSITSTVTNHTTQISTFQQTVDQIYASIEDVGSGEFSYILQKIDQIEMKVGAEGQSGSIQVAIDSIALTVTNHTTQISTFQQTVDQIYLAIEDVGSGEFASIITRLDEIELKVGAPGRKGSIQVALDSIALTVYDENTGMSAINQKADAISLTVTNHTTQISTFQQTVDQIYLAIEDVGSGEFASIITRLDEIELKVGAPGRKGSIQVAVDSVTTRVEDIDFGLTEVVQTVNSISSTVYDKHGALLSQITQDGETILIQASQIKLEGLVTTNNGFKILENGRIEATSAIFSGGITAQGWGEVPEMRVNIQSDFPSYQPGNTVGNIVVHGGYKLHMNRNNYETKYKITLDNHRADNYKVGQYNNINTIEVSPEKINIRREYNEGSSSGVLRKISAEINVDEFSSQLAIRLVGLPSSPVSGCVYRDSNGYLRMGL